MPDNPNGFNNILITGGAGYAGSRLVPTLLKKGYAVTVYDLFWYGEDVFDDCNEHAGLTRVRADIRDAGAVRAALEGIDAVLHLACISNDPSFEMNPELGTSINFGAFRPLLDAAVAAGVKRFVYASSSSVYGVKEEPDVREDAEPDPLTDYSRFKLKCEQVLLETAAGDEMTRVIVRPATLCGYAPRMRLDLTVNILTIHALVNHRIRIFGGKQLRPNLNILDMVRAYELFLAAPAEKIHCEPFNVGYQNRAVADIARIVKDVLADEQIELAYEPTDDIRSYHINSDKVRDVLGFEPEHTIEDAVQSIADAWKAGRLEDPMQNPMYYNIKRMKELDVV